VTDAAGPLGGLRILDLTRILAGPTCTQLLGDLGADVVKIERPGTGDDTRRWGPNFLHDKDGNRTDESSYYLAANRSKRSVTIDIAKAEGQALIRRLVACSDILIENFKVGGLAGYGLDYESLKGEFPRLVYCSITGFGQTGPYAPRAGYDFLSQGMGGIMSITGTPDGPPVKVGVGISDVMCGMYAAVAMLAAIRHRDLTGQGQYIDVALLDTQVAWLINEGMNYLLSGRTPVPLGNAHPNIVPYQTFETEDGLIILAVGNDGQFRRFCAFAGAPELADDARFATNTDRVHNREALIELIRRLIAARPSRHWLDGLAERGVPCGEVNTIDQVFEDPQVRHRGMRMAMPHPTAAGGEVPLIANPVKLSETPVEYRHAPPVLGQHTDEVLAELLDLDAEERAALRAAGVI
jgi:crotonobetainyl-CoA:carnitine CoA-transferase CaiB-like acyl-CoA transferase